MLKTTINKHNKYAISQKIYDPMISILVQLSMGNIIQPWIWWCGVHQITHIVLLSLCKKRAIYRLGIISSAHAPVHVTDFPVVNVYVDELSSARIWQHKLCATYSANVDINNRLPIIVCYRICTLRHIRIEINYGSQNVFWVLTWVDGY